MKDDKTIEIIDTKGVCSRLKCSRMTLYTKYKSKLEQVPSKSKKNFFTLKSVQDLISNMENPEFDSKYKILQ